MALTYEASVRRTVVKFSEFTTWQFSDPLRVDGVPINAAGSPAAFPTVAFGEVTANAVREPSSALLLLAGWGC